MRRFVRQVHLYLGLVLSLLFLAFAVTGAALVYKEAYWRLVYPELRKPPPDLSIRDHGLAIAVAHREFGDDLRSVKLPEPGVSAYHLYLDDGEAFMSAVDHRVIDRWRPPERAMSLLFDLHAHLMAGETGERVGGIIGLLGVLLAVTGLVVWWPARRQFALRNLLPRDGSRRGFLVWHRDLGVVASPILLVLLLSGSGLVFYGAAGKILNGLFGDRAPQERTPTAGVNPPAHLADTAALVRVEAEFPDARLVFYYPPRDGVAFNRFRLKQPCELHPNGRSYLYLDGAGGVLAKTDACALPPGERTLHTLYPLHAGKAESGVYKFIVFLGALALAALSLSGSLAYLRKLFGASNGPCFTNASIGSRSRGASRARYFSGRSSSAP